MNKIIWEPTHVVVLFFFRKFPLFFKSNFWLVNKPKRNEYDAVNKREYINTYTKHTALHCCYII